MFKKNSIKFLLTFTPVNKIVKKKKKDKEKKSRKRKKGKKEEILE